MKKTIITLEAKRIGPVLADFAESRTATIADAVKILTATTQTFALATAANGAGSLDLTKQWHGPLQGGIAGRAYSIW